MKPPKLVSKRAQPRLGTILRVSIERAGDISEADKVAPAFDAVFAEAARLEQIFNFHSASSELTRFNERTIGQTFLMSPELEDAFARASHLQEISGGVFDPWRDGRLDLSGFAKGYIVDRLATTLQQWPELAGVIDAGGDLRFFGDLAEPAKVHLRAGAIENTFVHELQIAPFTSVATSGPQGAEINSESSTRYKTSLKRTASVVAHDCATADAMTKVALFGTPEQIEGCCEELECTAFVFAEDGKLERAYGVQ